MRWTNRIALALKALVLCALLWAGVVVGPAIGLADGLADNIPDQVRRQPRFGVAVPPEERARLQQGLEQLARLLEPLRPADWGSLQRLSAVPEGTAPTEQLLASNYREWDLYADVAIFHRAVQQALDHDEFMELADIAAADQLIATGIERANQLQVGQPAWPMASGLVVRGYVSRIDGTVQPYGMLVPPSAVSGTPQSEPNPPVRCDVWFHGRNELLTELRFLQQRQVQPSEIAPEGVLVLHPYGRYCNAAKFAGEVDAIEALAAVRRNYPVDRNRIAMRGFSMGGASAWQMAVHRPADWFAATPGAGFSETPDFLKVFQQETLSPPWFEERLWRWYDCTGYAANLRSLPVVAYSGDQDRQKQAADIMSIAMEAESLTLDHIVGPQTGHKIHPDSARAIEDRLRQWAAVPPVLSPDRKEFVTYSLIYADGGWVQLSELDEHWQQARVVAQHDSTGRITLQTTNISRLQVALPASWFESGNGQRTVEVNGQSLAWPAEPAPVSGAGTTAKRTSDQPVKLMRVQEVWSIVPGDFPAHPGLVKQRGLCGPIDHAFMDSFVFVKPSGRCTSAAVQQWTEQEYDHAVTHWRRHMRGDVRIVTDTELTPEQIEHCHLVLWGDPRANSVLGNIILDLPIAWSEQQIVAGTQSFPAATHALIEIYPNPLNPRKYVVLNSGFTFREYDYLNNARQTPKLPDWSVIDVSTPPGNRYPGKIVGANFFDDHWGLKSSMAPE